MKNKIILVILLLSITILSGCTEKSEQANVPTNLITDNDKGESIKISENTENLFKEYSEDINNWIVNDREGDVYNKAGRLIESGYRIPQYSDLMNSIGYIKEGNRHMNIVIDLISG